MESCGKYLEALGDCPSFLYVPLYTFILHASVFSLCKISVNILKSASDHYISVANMNLFELGGHDQNNSA